MTFLELAYIGLSLTMTCIVLCVYGYALRKMRCPARLRNIRLFVVSASIAAWWSYTYLLAQSGFLKDLSFPPRFPLLLIAPLFLFTGVFLYRNRSSALIGAIPCSWPIYFQSFRILVELLFVATAAIGYLHKEVTIEGYNYDMLFGVSALLIAPLVFTFNILSTKVLLYWNYLGLLVLASVILLFTTTVFFPSLWSSEVSLAPIQFLDFPYIQVATYLMPMAVFVHVLSIIQLRQMGN